MGAPQLRSVALSHVPADAAPFPFSEPAVRTLPVMEFLTSVTFFVGANGSDKSTVMALGLASGPLSGSLAEMERRYGADLDANPTAWRMARA